MTRKRNVKPRFWLMLMTVMLVVFFGVYLSQEAFMSSQQGQIELLEAQRDADVQANAEIERKITFAKTDEYVERVAHEQLGLVKPGEIRYVAGGEAGTQSDE